MSDNSSQEPSSDYVWETRSEGFRFVDDYGLLVCLGEGGMGEVWAARDARSPKNRIIALKTTKQSGVEAAKVLYDEARIASLIDHPNVCRVHHLAKAGDVQYLVMDYCDGASLHDLLQALPNHRAPLDIACRVLANAAAGLHAAHTLTDEDGTALGVVHRDVSPQNLLISTKGVVTVTDFGVAKALGQAHKATETGEMKGKLSYMAPEQVTSKDVDARADVFALGCVLYQITLGRRPFHGDDALSTLYQLLEEELTLPTELDPSFPPELEAVIKKSLEKDREKRFQTAAEFRRALEEVLLHLNARVSNEDVAALMQTHMGAAIENRSQLIAARNEALNHFDRREAETLTSGTGGTPKGPRTADEQSVSATQRSTPPARKKGSNLTAFLVFALIVAGGAVVLTSKKGDKDVASQPEAAVTTPPTNAQQSPAPSTIPAEPVTLEVAVAPAEATISLDGEKVGQGRFIKQFAPSKENHVLKVEAKGYTPATQSLVLDKSQSITIALPAAAEPKVPTPPPRPKVPPKVAATTQPAPAPTKTPTKPPRKLDSDNPFASP